MRAFGNSYMHATFNTLYRLEYADGERNCWLINFLGGGVLYGVCHITDTFRVAHTVHIDIALPDKRNLYYATCVCLQLFTRHASMFLINYYSVMVRRILRSREIFSRIEGYSSKYENDNDSLFL